MLAVAEIHYIRHDTIKKDKRYAEVVRSMGTVRNYVSRRKAELLDEANEAALPLEHKLGAVQVDFDEAPFTYQGEEIVLPYSCLT